MINALIFIGILVAGHRPPIAQAIQLTSNDQGISFADSLRSRGVGTSPSELGGALRNADPQVRALAAYKLAEDHDSEAAQKIEVALVIEKNLQTRIDFSSALWSLGDEVGRKQLVAICNDLSLPPKAITDAASHLHMMGQDGRCENGILTLIDRATESYQRLDLLPFLPTIYSGASQKTIDRIVAIAQGMLNDKSPAVRISASHVLAQVGSKSSATVIRDASMRETDPVVRSSLQQDLAVLRNN
ncbi:HEAT repeat domain-containing protein (plasmid) [Tunturiibacter empetritectus]|uniref:HEAT repeat protein n=1 Tax=Tunturiibacter lichenicola TaxID=2051959 RepID=A0A852VKY8_9BACT|nr:HEAT repeat domain-containing protein [Edaphobacter lichenicola]NYF92290.1 HEAT repeat protein [Edaphobacter lichenicola]